jgi:hypothetical protein
MSAGSWICGLGIVLAVFSIAFTGYPLLALGVIFIGIARFVP